MKNSDSNHPKIIAPPPRLYICTFLIGVALHIIYPDTITDEKITTAIIGTALALISVGLVTWSFATMRSAKTSPNPYQPSAALVTQGPFKFSRNPIYVVMTGFYVGIAIIVNSAWILLLVMPLLALMQWGVIKREEIYLAKLFGETYTTYKTCVRPWL